MLLLLQFFFSGLKLLSVPRTNLFKTLLTVFLELFAQLAEIISFSFSLLEALTQHLCLFPEIGIFQLDLQF